MNIANTPLVSILVPIYNVERYIERCARSVFEQTYENLEFIFVDDCSPDDSVRILERVVEDYPQWKGRIKILYHDHNRGLAAARNTLVDACKGEFITHVDSDDWVEPNMVELLMKRQQETDADIVTGNAWMHRNGDKFACNSGNHLLRDEMLVSVIGRSISCTQWRRIIRTSVMRDNGLRWNEEYKVLEDLQTFPLILYFSKRVAGIDAFVYHYNYDNPNSETNEITNSVPMQECRSKVLHLIIDFFRDKEKPYRDALKDFILFEYQRSRKFALQAHHRKLYNEAVSMLDTLGKCHWASIGWDNKINRWLEHHYYLHRLTLPMRKWHGRIRSLVNGA